MDPNEWTPRHGWRIFWKRTSLRLVISLPILIAGALLNSWIGVQVGLPWDRFGGKLTAVFGGAVGFWMGWFVCKKLVEDTGLPERTLVYPAIGMLLGTFLLTYVMLYGFTASYEHLNELLFFALMGLGATVGAYRELHYG